MDAERVTRRLKDVPPDAMSEVLKAATDLYARDQTELARAEECQQLVEATEEAGLPSEYLERAAGLVLARQGARSLRRRRSAVLAAVGAALALWAGFNHLPMGERPATPHAATAPTPLAPLTPAPPRAATPEVAPLEGSGWSAVTTGAAFGGITPVSVGDGVPVFVTREGRRCMTTRPGTTPPSIYLYFDIEDSRARGGTGQILLAVEYFDAFQGGRLVLQYDAATGDELEAKYRSAEESSGAAYLGSRTWRTAFFRLEQPLFANRQNNHSDFRLALDGRPIEEARRGWPLSVRALKLTRTRPAEWIRDGG